MAENTFVTLKQFQEITDDLETVQQSLQEANAALEGLTIAVELLNSFDVPVGAMLPYPGATAPDHYLLCRGQSFDPDQYPELFVARGSVATVPDMRGRDFIGSNFTYVLGTMGGSASKVLSVAEMPSHNHTQDQHSHGVIDPGHAHSTYGLPSGAQVFGFGLVQSESFRDNVNINVAPLAGNPVSPATTNIGIQHSAPAINYTGQSASFSLMNPYFAGNYIIKAEPGGPGQGEGGGSAPEIGALAGRVSLLESEKDEQEERLDDIDSSIAALPKQFKGVWDNTKTYALNDFVVLFGSLWRSATAGNTTQPSSGPSWVESVEGVGQQFDDLETRVDTVESAVSGHESRLDDLEATEPAFPGGMMIAVVYDAVGDQWPDRPAGGAFINVSWIDKGADAAAPPGDALPNDLVYTGSPAVVTII